MRCGTSHATQTFIRTGEFLSAAENKEISTVTFAASILGRVSSRGSSSMRHVVSHATPGKSTKGATLSPPASAKTAPQGPTIHIRSLAALASHVSLVSPASSGRYADPPRLAVARLALRGRLRPAGWRAAPTTVVLLAAVAPTALSALIVAAILRGGASVASKASFMHRRIARIALLVPHPPAIRRSASDAAAPPPASVRIVTAAGMGLRRRAAVHA
mmetsp:Transcript_4519/g.12672  ORF Transcript_4519/g.12672 Transcript_4519/m.12672 type:complete len:217 (+) Transcript_4519:450-1100(+)